MPALDGIRGIAVLIVLLSHLSGFGLDLIPGADFQGIGKAGVYLFFVLSAWLLTNQAIQARESRGWSTLYWCGYLLRRCLRILPLYTTVLLFCVVATSYAWPISIIRMDLSDALRHLAMLEGRSIFWAIPVEFLFYGLLPVALAAAVFIGRFGNLSAGLGLFILLFMLPFVVPWGGAYTRNTINLWAYWPTFMVGMGLAYAGHHYAPLLRRWLKPCSIALFCLSMSLVLISVPRLTQLVFSNDAIGLDYFHGWIGPYAIIWGMVMACTLFGPDIIRTWLGHPALAITGRISFSIYLLHIPVIRAVTLAESLPSFLAAWIALIATIGCAAITYRVIELPAMNLGRRISRAMQSAPKSITETSS